MPDLKPPSHCRTDKELVETGCTSSTGPPQGDPSPQVRFLQILADKVVESLRTASDEKSHPDATIRHQ